jgi:hypothetical protein
MEWLAILASALALAVALAAVGLVWRSERRRLELAPGGNRTVELERHLVQLSHRLEVLESDVDAGHAGEPRAAVEAVPRGTAAISHIGLVRFDAFEDTGGAQSFALALVDDDGDGIVLTSLHSRPTTRVFIKTLRRGVADAPLSSEEEQALREAGIRPG